jgi:hypothetical protein
LTKPCSAVFEECQAEAFYHRKVSHVLMSSAHMRPAGLDVMLIDTYL